MQKIFAILLLVFILPLFFLIGLLVVLFSGKPMIFRQFRYGEKFKKFEILKFRTMRVNSCENLTDFRDNRITKIGYLLRIFKLDELPQLINIINGDMCFVGPRPEIVDIVDRNKKSFNFLDIIKPGITDISSIIFKNESKIFKDLELSEYETIILPLKVHLINISIEKKNVFYDMLVIIITSISLFNHNISILAIKFFFLNDLEIEFRTKLNRILSKQIF